MSYRPSGVTALAAFFIIFAVLGVIGAIVALIADISSLNVQSVVFTAIANASLFAFYFGVSVDTAILFTTILAISSYVSSQLSVGLYYIGVVAAIIVAVLYTFAAVGLLLMKRWGYILALILGILTIIGGVIGLMYIIGVIPLAFGIIVVVYLMRPVKYEFE